MGYMMFGVTECFVIGSKERPDLVLLYGKNDVSGSQEFRRVVRHPLNECGLVPGLSTLSGFTRATMSSVHAVSHSVMGALAVEVEERERHRAEAYLGVKNVKRGFWEMLPFYGNQKMHDLDEERAELMNNAALRGDVLGKVVLFGDEGLIAEKPYDEFMQRGEYKRYIGQCFSLRSGLTPIITFMQPDKKNV